MKATWRPEFIEQPDDSRQRWISRCLCGVQITHVWSAKELAWTAQHGDNPEHQRVFVTGPANNDDWPLIRQWIEEIHDHAC